MAQTHLNPMSVPGCRPVGLHARYGSALQAVSPVVLVLVVILAALAVWRASTVAIAQVPAPGFVLAEVWPAATTGLASPYWLSRGADDRLYAFDAVLEKVVVIDDTTGRRVAELRDEAWFRWPAANEPRDIWYYRGPINAAGLANGDVLVLLRQDRILRDRASAGIARYDRDGAVVWQTGLTDRGAMGGPAHPDRIWPAPMALSPDGNKVFVLDQGGPVVHAVDVASGRVLDGVEYLPPAGPRAPSQEFNWCSDLDVAVDGRLVVLDEATGEIALRRTRWSVDPRLPTSRFAAPARAVRVAAAPDGTLFVLDVDGTVRQYSNDGRPLAAFDATGPAPTQLTVISDLTILRNGAVAVADQSTGAIYVYEPAAVPPLPEDGAAARCRLVPSKDASPQQIVLGQTVTVTLAVDGTCPTRVGTDFAIVIERGRRRWLSDTSLPFAQGFIGAADLQQDRVSVVSYRCGFSSTLEVPLTVDRNLLFDRTSRIRSPGSSDQPVFDPRSGYEVAQQELAGPRGRDGARRVTVVLSSGIGHPGQWPWGTLAIRGAGTRIVTFMPQSEADMRGYSYSLDESLLFLRFIATGWWDYYRPGDYSVSDAAVMYDALSADGEPLSATVLAHDMTITDTVPANMAYVTDSAVPPASWDAARRLLTWRLTSVFFGGAQLTYQLAPEESGDWPTNVEARAAYTDGLGSAGDLLFPVPRVAVIAPTATPTVTLGPTAPATRMPSPTATPTASKAPTVTSTATRVPSPSYLPVALREHCGHIHERPDIALAIDTSGSMTGQKIEDAKAAALSFVGLIDLAPGRSQVAVVRFDREAEVVRELTNARALIEAAIRNLQVRSGTHIDKGLRAALGELQSPRHTERNAQVLILLTDGVQTGTPGEELRAAAEVHAASVLVYTIGLGADVDEATLRTIAGDDGRYHVALDSGDLARIYGEIARDLMCPGVDLWGGR